MASVLIMRLIKNGVVYFVMSIANNQGFFNISKYNFSFPFLLSEYANIALVERNVLETSSEEVTEETISLRNRGKEAEMRKKWMIWQS